MPPLVIAHVLKPPVVVVLAVLVIEPCTIVTLHVWLTNVFVALSAADPRPNAVLMPVAVAALRLVNANAEPVETQILPLPGVVTDQLYTDFVVLPKTIVPLTFPQKAAHLSVRVAALIVTCVILPPSVVTFPEVLPLQRDWVAADGLAPEIAKTIPAPKSMAPMRASKGLKFI